jgi:hypothetical protein
MKKDPAVLFYFSDWFRSTANMPADARGWYLNLLMHQYELKELPGNIKELATLAVVRPNEYKRFKQVFEQVLKQRFKQTDNGNYINEYANQIIQGRELFKTKRSNAGKLSYILKVLHQKYPKWSAKKAFIDYLKNNIDLDIDIKNEQVLKQVFEHLFELYTNVNINIESNIKTKKNSISNNMADVKNFYKTEIEENSDKKYIDLYVSVVKYIFEDNIKNILQLSDQLSYILFERIAEKGYNYRQITSKISALENYPNVTSKYSSFYRTLKNWLSNDAVTK